MFRKKRYRYNHKTLAYELHRTPLKVLFSRGFVVFLFTVAASVGYFWIYSYYFKLDTPKMLELRRQNADLLAKLDLMNHQIEQADLRLEQLKQRDNNVYRPIFGLEGIPDDVRNAGFGGVDRYSHLEYAKNSGFLTDIALRFDQLYKKTAIQSTSFDEVGKRAEQKDEMAASMPTIFPVNLAQLSKFRISSSFGYRKDPVYGDHRMHWGIDVTGPVGSEVYAAGNGIVVQRGFEYFGYGNYVVIDHGFGYKTRYAHLKSVTVMEGQKISRGESVGLLGSTGKSTGPHLHYEVIYMNRPVNPYNYFSSNIGSEEYDDVINAKGQ